MGKQSAGILLYKTIPDLQVFLVHPGGPFYLKKDIGVWSIPKGEFDKNDDPLEIAIKEFEEETGNTLSFETTKQLQPVKLKSGKTIYAWLIETDCDKNFICSNTFDLEWPPKSGKLKQFPEIDDAHWFSLSQARKKIHPGQISFLQQLEIILKNRF